MVAQRTRTAENQGDRLLCPNKIHPPPTNTVAAVDRAVFHETASTCQPKSTAQYSLTCASIRILMDRSLPGPMPVDIQIKARRCNLSRELNGSIPLTQSPENLRFASHLQPIASRHPFIGKGLNSSPLTHKECSTTASFRATATMARLVAFVPPALASPHCRSALSGPNRPST